MAGVIVTVTPNMALDVTYRIPAIVSGASLRITDVRQRGGGKGVNVARVLHGLGHDVCVVGLVGGDTGTAIVAELDAAGLPHDLGRVSQETRRTIALVDDRAEATMLLEPGRTVTTHEWQELLARVEARSAEASALVLSGSLPAGAPVDGYAALTRIGRGGGIPVILDTSGPALSAGLAARPNIIKPNVHEIADVTADLPQQADVLSRAQRLRSQGAEAVVCSLGADGMTVVAQEGAWTARLGEGVNVSGNPTGAGDAAVAALALGLRDGTTWPERLRDAVALSAAAVVHPLAGSIDLGTFHELLPAVEVTNLDVRYQEDAS
jgi:tagatose 6-phosphate kinase